MKPYPSYKDSGVEWVGEIPGHWERTRLKYISRIITGNTPSKKDEHNYENGEFLWVKPDEIKGFYPTNETKEKLTEKGRSLSRVIPPFSVFVNGIGNIGRFGFSEKEVSTNQQINSVVFNEKCIFRFGLYLISTMEDESQKQSEKVVVSILSKSRQENVETVIPPLSAQYQIVEYLDEQTQKIDELIEKTEKKIELLKEKRTSLINYCVTKGLNPNVEMKDSGVEWIGEIPSEWSMSKLKYFSVITLGKMLTPQDKGGYHLKPYLRGRNIQVDTVDIDDVKEMWFSDDELSKYRLKKGDLLVSEGGDVGRTCMWKNELDQCYIQNSVNRVDIINGSKKYYLYHFYLYHQGEYFGSIVNRVSIPHLTKEKLENVVFIELPVTEQHQIVEYLDEQTQKIDTTIEKETKRIELLKEYRQSLISEVATGKIDVREEIVI